MAKPLIEIEEPDNSGTDAYQRYRFQAHVAFSDCMRCAFGQGVERVTCEYFEDLLVEEPGRLRFVQIKSRNQDYGPWELKDLCRKGGALRSLLRTHRALVELEEEREVIYEVRLEGALKRNDLIERLPVVGPGSDDDVAKAVRDGMKSDTDLDLAEARALMDRVRIETVPLRESIEDWNFRFLVAAAGHLAANDLRAVAKSVIELISMAMEGNLLRYDWPASILRPCTEDAELATKVVGKQLEIKRLREAFGPVLEEATAATLANVDAALVAKSSDLDRKLRLAGASEAVIEKAKLLRAAAARREIEIRAASLKPDLDGLFEDLEARILLVCQQSLTAAGSGESPADAVFSELLSRFATNSEAHDPAKLLRQDHALLTGGACEASDRCKFDWSAHD